MQQCSAICSQSSVPLVADTYDTMDSPSPNLTNIPVDVVVCILKRLLSVGCFEDFFHCFVAWCRSQRRGVIIQLLRAYPIEELYHFSSVNSPSEVGYFYRFLFIACRLEIPAARCFVPCKNLVCGVGNIDAQLDVLLGLSIEGHFFSKVAWVAFQLLYNGGDSISVASSIRDMFGYPNCGSYVAEMVRHLEIIAANEPVNPLFLGRVAVFRCNSHPVPLIDYYGEEEQNMFECHACNICFVLGPFSRSFHLFMT
ncbi:hypothetical protein DCAR_0104597 [Daucus carota subsp. sativus]|uniref:Uncharacterized protein n=1 Tax=Daucus carota subsp. sativus TaxID=79200 RepID=A0A166IYB7_DAUCS|nr:hypothetical protein DCAR_0104597 [Daucus carota subsp. sativus]